MVTLSSTAANAAAISQQQAFDPFAAASGAVLNLVACCCLGVTASRYRVLDQQALSALSRLVYNVFQPSLLFTNVLQILATPSQTRGTIFLLPLAAAVQIVTAAGISRVLLRLVGLNPFSEAGREVRICSTFANAGPLPLLFVDALFKNHPDPTLRTRAVAFISFYLLAWSPLFWNYGYGILVDKTEETGGKKGQPMEYSSLGTQSVGGPRLGSGTGGAGMMVKGNGSAAAMVLEEGFDGKEAHATNWTSPHQQQYSRQQVPCSECRSDPSHALVRSALEKARRVAHSRAMKKLLNPPTLGCTLGALVGVCSPLRGLLFGDTAPFSCVFSALRTMGSAYVPSVLLILSGSLAQAKLRVAEYLNYYIVCYLYQVVLRSFQDCWTRSNPTKSMWHPNSLMPSGYEDAIVSQSVKGQPPKEQQQQCQPSSQGVYGQMVSGVSQEKVKRGPNKGKPNSKDSVNKGRRQQQGNGQKMQDQPSEMQHFQQGSCLPSFEQQWMALMGQNLTSNRAPHPLHGTVPAGSFNSMRVDIQQVMAPGVAHSFIMWCMSQRPHLPHEAIHSIVQTQAGILARAMILKGASHLLTMEELSLYVYDPTTLCELQAALWRAANERVVVSEGWLLLLSFLGLAPSTGPTLAPAPAHAMNTSQNGGGGQNAQHQMSPFPLSLPAGASPFSLPSSGQGEAGGSPFLPAPHQLQAQQRAHQQVLAFALMAQQQQNQQARGSVPGLPFMNMLGPEQNSFRHVLEPQASRWQHQQQQANNLLLLQDTVAKESRKVGQEKPHDSNTKNKRPQLSGKERGWRQAAKAVGTGASEGASLSKAPDSSTRPIAPLPMAATEDRWQEREPQAENRLSYPAGGRGGDSQGPPAGPRDPEIPPSSLPTPLGAPLHVDPLPPAKLSSSASTSAMPGPRPAPTASVISQASHFSSSTDASLPSDLAVSSSEAAVSPLSMTASDKQGPASADEDTGEKTRYGGALTVSARRPDVSPDGKEATVFVAAARSQPQSQEQEKAQGREQGLGRSKEQDEEQHWVERNDAAKGSMATQQFMREGYKGSGGSHTGTTWDSSDDESDMELDGHAEVLTSLSLALVGSQEQKEGSQTNRGQWPAKEEEGEEEEGEDASDFGVEELEDEESGQDSDAMQYAAERKLGPGTLGPYRPLTVAHKEAPTLPRKGRRVRRRRSHAIDDCLLCDFAGWMRQDLGITNQLMARAISIGIDEGVSRLVKLLKPPADPSPSTDDFLGVSSISTPARGRVLFRKWEEVIRFLERSVTECWSRLPPSAGPTLDYHVKQIQCFGSFLRAQGFDFQLDGGSTCQSTIGLTRLAKAMFGRTASELEEERKRGKTQEIGKVEGMKYALSAETMQQVRHWAAIERWGANRGGLDSAQVMKMVGRAAQALKRKHINPIAYFTDTKWSRIDGNLWEQEIGAFLGLEACQRCNNRRSVKEARSSEAEKEKTLKEIAEGEDNCGLPALHAYLTSRKALPPPQSNDGMVIGAMMEEVVRDPRAFSLPFIKKRRSPSRPAYREPFKQRSGLEARTSSPGKVRGSEGVGGTDRARLKHLEAPSVSWEPISAGPAAPAAPAFRGTKRRGLSVEAQPSPKKAIKSVLDGRPWGGRTAMRGGPGSALTISDAETSPSGRKKGKAGKSRAESPGPHSTECKADLVAVEGLTEDLVVELGSWLETYQGMRLRLALRKAYRVSHLVGRLLREGAEARAGTAASGPRTVQEGPSFPSPAFASTQALEGQRGVIEDWPSLQALLKGARGHPSFDPEVLAPVFLFLEGTKQPEDGLPATGQLGFHKAGNWARREREAGRKAPHSGMVEDTENACRARATLQGKTLSSEVGESTEGRLTDFATLSPRAPGEQGKEGEVFGEIRGTSCRGEREVREVGENRKDDKLFLKASSSLRMVRASSPCSETSSTSIVISSTADSQGVMSTPTLCAGREEKTSFARVPNDVPWRLSAFNAEETPTQHPSSPALLDSRPKDQALVLKGTATFDLHADESGDPAEEDSPMKPPTPDVKAEKVGLKSGRIGLETGEYKRVPVAALVKLSNGVKEEFKAWLAEHRSSLTTESREHYAKVVGNTFKSHASTYWGAKKTIKAKEDVVVLLREEPLRLQQAREMVQNLSSYSAASSWGHFMHFLGLAV